MKIYLPQTVYDAALDRIRWLFDEFPQVVCNFSGGKDSTVTLNLCLKVAEEKGRLPLDVLFIDQEAEWESVIEYVRTVRDDPRVRMHWWQIPVRIENATSNEEAYITTWDPEKKDVWMRQQEPGAITQAPPGIDKWYGLFEAISNHMFPDTKMCHIAGVRCSESPARMKGLTSYETYGGATWGRVGDKKRQHYTMYPLYDWGDSDVWAAIHKNKWAYCPVYDYMFQYGVPLKNMRVSSLHHETAIHNLFFLQEVEGETWTKLTRRLRGINSAGHLRQDMFSPKELPFMFTSWREYRDFLLEKLIVDPDNLAKFRKQFGNDDAKYEDPSVLKALTRLQIGAILTNDHHGTKIASFHASHGQYSKGRGTKGGLQISGGISDNAPEAHKKAHAHGKT